MTTCNDQGFLKVQLLELHRLKNLVAGHPLMSKAFDVREQELREMVQAGNGQGIIDNGQR